MTDLFFDYTPNYPFTDYKSQGIRIIDTQLDKDADFFKPITEETNKIKTLTLKCFFMDNARHVNQFFDALTHPNSKVKTLVLQNLMVHGGKRFKDTGVSFWSEMSRLVSSSIVTLHLKQCRLGLGELESLMDKMNESKKDCKLKNLILEDNNFGCFYHESIYDILPKSSYDMFMTFESVSVRRMDGWSWTQLDYMFEGIKDSNNLKSLDFSYNDILVYRPVVSELLASVKQNVNIETFSMNCNWHFYEFYGDDDRAVTLAQTTNHVKNLILPYEDNRYDNASQTRFYKHFFHCLSKKSVLETLDISHSDINIPIVIGSMIAAIESGRSRLSKVYCKDINIPIEFEERLHNALVKRGLRNENDKNPIFINNFFLF